MEFVIMGLLMIQPMSLYALNKSFEEGISLFYSASLGSLQSAIKGLLNKGWIQVENTSDNHRNKKLYTLLPSGQDAFYQWMTTPLPESKLEVGMLSKVYFLGLIPDPQLKKTVLLQLLQQATAASEALNTAGDQLDHLDIPHPYREIFKYQRATLSYGQGAHTFALNWIQTLLKEL